MQQESDQVFTFDKMALAHYQWLQSKNWTSATPLESLALITSEIGEAMNEIHEDSTEALASELADIVLRILGFMMHHNKVPKVRLTVLPMWSATPTKVHTELGNLIPFIAVAVNACRKGTVESECFTALECIVQLVVSIAYNCHIDLIKAIESKMQKNLSLVTQRII